MGRKNKNVLGGAASGAAAGTSVAPGWGTAIGAVAGGLLGGMNDTEPNQVAPAVPKEVVDRLYAESVGAAPTVGELRNNAMYDKTLAQQIAAAAAARNVNPGLLQRNVARIAAEQSQAAAQANAQMAAEQRNQALAKYLQAQQLNAQVNQFNVQQQDRADAASNQQMGAGFNALAGSFAQQAMKQDAQKQIDSAAQKAGTESNTIKSPYSTEGLSLSDSTSNAQKLNNAYTLGATSDKKAKQKIKSESMKMVSDERQKDLIKTEDLPSNANMQQQTMQAVQPAAAPTETAAPQQAPAPMAQAATPQPVQAPKPTFEITADMLQKASKSAKSGGNVADIQNVQGTMQRGPQEIDQATLDRFAGEAKRQQRRDMFGNPIESDRQLFDKFVSEWYTNRDAQNAAYDTEQANLQQVNAIKDAQRMARLNKFYTGISTPNQGLIASQYAPQQQAINTSWNANKGNSPVAPSMAGLNLFGISDENAKTDKKKEGSKDFNPKNFLDKLQAYSYEYKDGAKDKEGAGDGRYLSVMAQDLEKAGPVGKSMVSEDESGMKQVDYGKGFGAILASQAHLNERLSQLEKLYGKKKDK